MKKAIVTGNVGRDPEIRVDPAGGEYATFSIGVNVGNKQNPKTDWVDISCGGKLVDLARNFIRKGTKLLVEGFPSVSAYLNKDNKPVAALRIYANSIELLSKKEEAIPGDDYSGDPVYTLPETGHATTNDIKPDDIPF